MGPTWNSTADRPFPVMDEPDFLTCLIPSPDFPQIEIIIAKTAMGTAPCRFD
jgi:hypothetical protein